MANSSERKIFHPVGEIRRRAGLGEQLQVRDGPADGDAELVGVNDPGERLTTPLAPGRLGQQVFILAEQHATELGGAVQQGPVFQLRCVVDLSGQNIHFTKQQSPVMVAGTWTSI